MSESVWPHKRQPTRLPRPWDSPGKNTGVGWHFLLQCKKVKSESEVTQSFLTLCDPMDCSLSGFSIHGIFQARVLEWGAIAFSNKQGQKTHSESASELEEGLAITLFDTFTIFWTTYVCVDGWMSVYMHVPIIFNQMTSPEKKMTSKGHIRNYWQSLDENTTLPLTYYTSWKKYCFSHAWT